MSAARTVKVTVTGDDVADLCSLIEHVIDTDPDFPTAAADRIATMLRDALNEAAAAEYRRHNAIAAAVSPAVAGRIFALRHEGIVPTIDHTNRTDRAGFGSRKDRL